MYLILFVLDQFWGSPFYFFVKCPWKLSFNCNKCVFYLFVIWPWKLCNGNKQVCTGNKSWSAVCFRGAACALHVWVIFEAQHDDWNHPETIVSMATKAGESERFWVDVVCERLRGAPTQTEHAVLGVERYSHLVNKRASFFVCFFSFKCFKVFFCWITDLWLQLIH